MRPIYRASFPLLRECDEQSLSKAAIECLKWIFVRNGRQIPSNVALGAETISRCEPDEGSLVEAIRVDIDDDRSWGVIYEHPDALDKGLIWRTEIALNHSVNRGLDFSCSTLLGNTDGTLAPFRRAPGRPRIVESLLTTFDQSDPEALSVMAKELTSEDSIIEDFLEFLYSKDRKHPLVLVTATNFHDKPLVVPDELASWLAGLAHVYVCSSRFPSLKLKEHLPTSLNCWDGGIRIYWPGFRDSDSPFRHRVWSPETVRRIEEQPHSRGFKEFLLGRICNVAVYNVHDRFLTWDKLVGLNRRHLLDQASSRNDFELLANDYANENDSLRRQLDELREQVREQSQEAERARNEADAWRSAYEAERKGESNEEAVELPVVSVVDAIERAKKQFPDELVFALNSRSQTDSPFEAPDEVMAAFTFLAKTYREAKCGIVPCPSLNDAIRNMIDAWFYTGGQSEITMKSYKSWYQCTSDGRTYWLGEHIGTGTSTDPRHTIRIAFDWDSINSRVIIGFIGQHQRDDNS